MRLTSDWISTTVGILWKRKRDNENEHDSKNMQGITLQGPAKAISVTNLLSIAMSTTSRAVSRTTSQRTRTAHGVQYLLLCVSLIRFKVKAAS